MPLIFALWTLPYGLVLPVIGMPAGLARFIRIITALS